MGKALNKSRESAVVQRIANALHQVQVVMQVVDGGEHGAEHFATSVKVMQVRSAESTSPALFP